MWNPAISAMASPKANSTMSDPPPSADVKTRGKAPLAVAPWLALLAMAAFWPRRKKAKAQEPAEPLRLTPEEIAAFAPPPPPPPPVAQPVAPP